MARPLWSGTIQISLVGFAVDIYPATSTTRPFSFHELDRNTMTRVRRQGITSGATAPGETADDNEVVDSGASKTSLHIAPKLRGPETSSQVLSEERAVEKADIIKGYEYAKGKYAIVEPEELKNLRLAGKKTIEISQFCRAAEIDPALYEKPYFVFPKPGPQATAFAVMRQSMFDSGMIGVGEIVFSGRQHLMTLAPPLDPEQPGMMLYALRFAAEMRNARDYSTNTDAPRPDVAQLKLAKQLIEAYTHPFEISRFKDQYEDALRELVEAKINNLPAPQPEEERKAGKVIDLMEALRKSVAQTGATRSTLFSYADTRAGKSSDKKPSAPRSAKPKRIGITKAVSKKPKSA